MERKINLLKQIPALISIWTIENEKGKLFTLLHNFLPQIKKFESEDLFPYFLQVKVENRSLSLQIEEKGKIYPLRIFPLDSLWSEFFETEKVLIGLGFDQKRECKADILNNISQEIRCPLNGIIGMTDLLVDTPLSTTQFEYLDTIRQCSYTFMGMVNDITDFSRLISGKVKPSFKGFSLRETIESSYEIIAFKAREKDIQFTFSLDRDLPAYILFDEKLLRQILVNLFLNAVRFINLGEKEGQITIKVKGKKISKQIQKSKGKISYQKKKNSRYSLEFSIADNGIGIEKKVQDRLFDSFTQLNSTINKNGLGLAISQGLIELLGGKIWVESEIGSGSTFYFTLEVQEYSGPKIDDRSSESLRGKSILIVDNSEENQMNLYKFFLKWKMRPLGLSSAEEALLYLRSGSTFDAAFIDLYLPKMSGYQLAEQIGDLKIKMPLIGINGNFQAQETSDLSIVQMKINRSHESKVFRYILTKPIKESKLYNLCLDLFTLPLIPNFPPEKIRILLVETPTSDRGVLKSTLQKLGYLNIAICHHGIECLEKIENRYDLILLADIKIPKKDGYSIARSIYLKYSLSERPVIIACTTNIEKERKHSRAKYIDTFLAKPIFSHDLDLAIKKELGKKKDRQNKEES